VASRLKAATLVTIRALLSVLFAYAFMYLVNSTFHQYDWGHAKVKFVCFAAVGLLLVHASAGRSTPDSRVASVLEILLGTVVVVLILTHYGRAYGQEIFDAPRGDIGQTTVAAASLLLERLENPYSSDQINTNPALDPAYRGYHYGPLMLLAYAPAVFEARAFKALSVLYALLSAVLLCLLVRDPGKSRLHNAASASTVLALFLLPERLWFEILGAGVNDIFPVALVLASLLMLRRRRYFWMAVFAGLSFSAKFSPAAFLILHFLRGRHDRGEMRAVVQGLAIGLAPLVPFLIWNARGLLNNVFVLRLVLDFDSTSLYSVVPAWLHLAFPAALLLSVVWVLWRGRSSPLAYEDVLVSFSLLLIVAEVTYKEVHANHLIWFYPLFALILSSGRRGLLRFGPDGV